MNISVICAMEREAALIARSMAGTETGEAAGSAFTRGRLGPHTLTLLLSGIGKANAAAAVQLAADRFGPAAVLNIGMAGNCSGRLPLGGAVIAERLVYHDFDMRWAAESAPFADEFIPDRPLAELAARVAGELGVPHIFGAVATGDVFVQDVGLRDDIAARTGCACIDMEGAAAAHMALKNGLRFASVKLMSDDAGDNALDAFHESLSQEEYCARSAGIIEGIVRGL
jgi:adenosylhomocysteine nucleosidase